MTEAEARARIVLFADANSDPCIASEELDIFVSMARRMDENGVEPSDTENWTPTWDINYAVAQCWLLKAGRLAGFYMFMAGGKMFSRQQFYDHCMKMHYKFLMKSPLKAQRLGRDEDLLANVPTNV